jgi:quercetin dioxygenase-like cupin family protein
MKSKSVFICSAFAIGVVALPMGTRALAETNQNGFVRFTPEQIRWEPFPGAPNGVEFATLAGDPAKSGSFYTIRVKFPPGVLSAPHVHPEDRYVTVIKGTWYTGTSDTFDINKAVPLKPGSYMYHPAKAVHWDGAKDEEVIVEISGIGPGSSLPVKPEAGLFISTKK